MTTLGEDWYQYFWDGFLTYVMEHSEGWANRNRDKQWTNFMFAFLKELATDMGFEYKEEESNIQSMRFDMVWQARDTPPRTVIIEHENNWVDVALKEEIPKLAKYKADVHVCITYVKEKDYPGNNYANKVRSLLKEKGYSEEFLLVLGTGNLASPTDWVCHRIYQKPELDIEKIILPSPIELAPKVGTRPELEGPTQVEDWMINRLRVWKRVWVRGGSVTREELHKISAEVGMDNRGLGGFFVGKNKSLHWKEGRACLSEKAIKLVKQHGEKVD